MSAAVVLRVFSLMPIYTTSIYMHLRQEQKSLLRVLLISTAELLEAKLLNEVSRLASIPLDSIKDISWKLGKSLINETVLVYMLYW